MASWLVRWTPERVVWVRALAGYKLCCVLGQDTLQCLSLQVYKWVPVNLMLGVNPMME